MVQAHTAHPATAAELGASTDMHALMTGMLWGSVVLLLAVILIASVTIRWFLAEERRREKSESAGNAS
jgi:hypothetical protein